MEAWTSLRNGDGLPQRNNRSVDALVSTRWGQRSPYNALCPSECVTGCVATAMAQLMKFWEYPNRGTGSYSYYHSTYGQQSANFGVTTYDWDNMPIKANSSSPEPVVNALSTLMYHCGVSVDMNYGPEASSASAMVVANALTSYFRYASSASFELQYDYSDEGWKSMLRGEFDAGRPVFYGGQSDRGGHAFICDGYDNMGLFHFNWGWNGRDDGYFQIGALNTYQGPFNVLNYSIVGIQPPSFAIAAPTNVNAQVDGDQVNLTWSAVSGSVMYKVYRDNELVEPMALRPSFTDTDLGYGTHEYYVKAISYTGDRSPRSTVVEVVLEPQALQPTHVGAEPQGYDLFLSWDMPFASEEELYYATDSWDGTLGYSGNHDTYWGQRYPVSLLKPFAGFTIHSVSVFIPYIGTYTLRIGKGTDEGVSEYVVQKDYPISTTGWKEMVLDSPLVLDCTSDLWIVLRASQAIAYPAAYMTYSGSAAASHISTDLNAIASYSSPDKSWLIKVNMREDGYTYKLARDGSVVASGLSGRSYKDYGLSSGYHNYQVWSALNGVYCPTPTQLSIDLAKIDLVIENPSMGSVRGAGLAEIGKYITVEAVPSAGSSFLCWKENGVVVSTAREYSFVVSKDTQLQACFSGVGVDENEDDTTVRKVEVFTLGGEKLGTFDGVKLDALENYAEGVYLLRITTDKGVITKKVIR